MGYQDATAQPVDLSSRSRDFVINVQVHEKRTESKRLRTILDLARKGLKWEEPADPVQIAGPIYFVGIKGLGAFLITTSAG